MSCELERTVNGTTIRMEADLIWSGLVWSGLVCWWPTGAVSTCFSLLASPSVGHSDSRQGGASHQVGDSSHMSHDISLSS